MLVLNEITNFYIIILNFIIHIIIIIFVDIWFYQIKKRVLEMFLKTCLRRGIIMMKIDNVDLVDKSDEWLKTSRMLIIDKTLHWPPQTKKWNRSNHWRILVKVVVIGLQRAKYFQILAVNFDIDLSDFLLFIFWINVSVVKYLFRFIQDLEMCI